MKNCDAISPIHGLPDDVLREIFAFVPAQYGSYRVSNALLVASVCRRWREVALSSGSLWALIDFRDDPQSRLARLSLSRSRQCDLSVTIDTRTSDVPVLGSSSVHRWRDLTLVVEATEDAHSAITAYLDSSMQNTTRLPRLRSPRLRSLSLIFSPDLSLTMDDLLNLKLFELACVTDLRELHFQHIDPSVEAALYTHITYLSLAEIKCCSLRNIYLILRESPQLRTLKLRDIVPTSHEDYGGSLPDDDQPFKMAHLEELTIEFGRATDVTRFLFDRLNLSSPTLRYLAIEIYKNGSDVNVSSFLSRTPSIRHLRLCSEPGSHPMYLGIPSLVNLETLTFGDEGYYSEFDDLDFLMHFRDNACPNLVELNVHLADTTDHLPSIKEFIERRAVSNYDVAPIRTVSFDCLHNHSSEKQREWDRAWFGAFAHLAQWKFHDVIEDLSPEYHSRIGYPCPSSSKGGIRE